ncbi:MAG: hypothetical protein GX846_03770, partial [Deltaproteobacteria bacterium]|nr:hypothetical protein [Deltaproteobacteria bacterium]
MKRLSLVLMLLLLNAGVLYASGYDAVKGSFNMYNPAVEMTILTKIKAQTDPETGLAVIGGLKLKFEYLANTLEVVEGHAVAPVHFSDGEDKYMLDYYVDGDNVVKIILVTKNHEYINKELYTA